MKILSENKKKWKVYFSEPHNEWADYKNYSDDYKELDNFVFEATLVPDGCYRGRSAAGFTFLDVDTGSRFTMRIAKAEEFFQAIARGEVKVVKNAKVTVNRYRQLGPETYIGGFKAKFTFFKQGSNYSIGLAGDTNE